MLGGGAVGSSMATDGGVTLGGAAMASLPFLSYSTPLTNKFVTRAALPFAGNFGRSSNRPLSGEVENRANIVRNNYGLLGDN